MSPDALGRRICERYTPVFCRELAAKGRVRLAAIPRYERWDGNTLLLHSPGRRVELRRATDYEFVPFSHDVTWADLSAACDGAVRELGRRLEHCLAGEPSSKSFLEASAGMLPHRGGGVGTLKGVQGLSMLYSVGSVPRLLKLDDVAVLRREDDRCEVRFGYYAEVGPYDKAYQTSDAERPS